MADQEDELRAQAVARGLIDPPQLPMLQDDDDPERPEGLRVELPVDGQRLSVFAKEIGAAVAGKGCYLWRDVVVTIDAARGERVEMGPHRFRSWVERHVSTVKKQFGRKGGFAFLPQTMAVEHAQGCLAADEFRQHLPRLARINGVRLPVLRKSGKVELLPEGYDAETETFTLASGLEYDETLTLEQAVFMLRGFHREFPFAEKGEEGCRSEAVHMCNFLSQFGYFLMRPDELRAHFIYAANSSGSGKSLLIKVVLSTVWGLPAVDALPKEQKALQDLLDSTVLGAAPFVAFDDVDGFVRSALLNGFMTAEVWSGRKFHTQDKFHAPKTAVMMLAGNNMEVSPDVARRTLRCDLFREQADAQERVIEEPLTASRLRSVALRGQLLSALWAIVRTWAEKRHELEKGRRLAGFEDWSDIYGGMVRMAGFGDPLEAPPEDGFGNTEGQDVLLMVQSLAEGVQRSHEYEFAEVVERAVRLGCFEGMLEGKEEKAKHAGMEEEHGTFVLTPKAKSWFGKLLARYGGQIFTTKEGLVKFGAKGKNRTRKYLVEVRRG